MESVSIRALSPLEAGEAGHLSRSLRAREGDEVLVGDGAGGRYGVKLGSVTRDLVEGSIESAETIEPAVSRLVLYQAPARPAKMDVAVERAAESGISSLLWPLGSSHLKEQEPSILPWESESGRGLAGVLPESSRRSIGIIVGLEGGFAEEEASMLIRSNYRYLEPGGPRGAE